MKRKLLILFLLTGLPVLSVRADDFTTGSSFFTSLVNSFLETEGESSTSGSATLPSEPFGSEEYTSPDVDYGDEGCSQIFVSDYSSSLVGATYNYPGADAATADDYEVYNDGVFSYSIIWNTKDNIATGDNLVFTSGGSTVTLTAARSGTYVDESGNVQTLTAASNLLVLVDQTGRVFSSFSGGTSEYVKLPISGGEWIMIVLALIYALYIFKRKKSNNSENAVIE